MAKDYKPNLNPIPAALMALAANSLTVSGGLSTTALAGTSLVAAPPALIGTLFAAGVYMLYKHFSVDEDPLQRALNDLMRTDLKVKVNHTSGALSTTVNVAPQAKSEAQEPPKEEPVTTVTESKNGNTTVYHIQNLNLYLNAKIVQQMNVNPTAVINTLDKVLSNPSAISSEQASDCLPPADRQPSLPEETDEGRIN